MTKRLILLLALIMSISFVYADSFGLGNDKSNGFGYGQDIQPNIATLDINIDCGSGIIQNISHNEGQCVPLPTGGGNISGGGSDGQLAYWLNGDVKGIPDIKYESNYFDLGNDNSLIFNRSITLYRFINGNLLFRNLYSLSNGADTILLGLTDDVIDALAPALNLNVTGNIHSNQNISAKNIQLTDAGTSGQLTYLDNNNNVKGIPISYTDAFNAIYRIINFDRIIDTSRWNVLGSDISGREVSTGIRDCGDEIPLKEGWNAISISPNETYDFTNRTIELKAGKNLIGYSSAISTNVNKIVKTDGLNVEFYYVDDSDLNTNERKRANILHKNQAYWVDANIDGNITFIGVGGSKAGSTYNWSDLMFRNEETGEVKNITDAAEDGWVDPMFRYWVPEINAYRFIQSEDIPFMKWKNRVSSWEGIFIDCYANENITLLRQDSPHNENQTCYGRTISGEGIFKTILFADGTNMTTASTGSGSPMNYTNIALTNQSNTFQGNQTINGYLNVSKMYDNHGVFYEDNGTNRCWGGC